jgi:hypothetical protein
MGKSSRTKGKVTVRPKRKGTLAYSLIMAAIVVFGVAFIALQKNTSQSAGKNLPGPNIGDHWHAAFGVNICGQWKPNVPLYEKPTGIHSHGDGFIHMHPFSAAGANTRATVGLFMSQAGDKVSSSEIKLAQDGTHVKNGDDCKSLGQPGKVRWSVNDQERTGDIAKYVPKDGEVVALAFLPPDQGIGSPPVARGGARPNDLPGSPVPPASPPGS